MYDPKRKRLKFVSNYVYAPNDFSTCLCFWKEDPNPGREEYVDLFRINKYCRIHGTEPKIQEGERFGKIKEII